MQGLLKVKDIRGVIPSLSSLLCIHFPGRRPPAITLPSPHPSPRTHPDVVPVVVPYSSATTFQLHPLSVLPMRAVPCISSPGLLMPLYLSHSLLLALSLFHLVSPWQCRISSDTPKWSLITKKTDHAINFINYCFYACNNRPVLQTLKTWLRCFCSKYFWVTQGLTWWWSTGLPNTSPTHTSCNSSPQWLQWTFSRSLHFKSQQWFLFVPAQEGMMGKGKGPPELKQCRCSSSPDCKPQGFQQS